MTTYKLLQSNKAATETSFNEMFKQNPNVKLAAFDAVNAQPVDLTQAAENSLHAVVHIRSTQEAKTRTVQQAPDIFDFFFNLIKTSLFCFFEGSLFFLCFVQDSFHLFHESSSFFLQAF